MKNHRVFSWIAIIGSILSIVGIICAVVVFRSMSIPARYKYTLRCIKSSIEKHNWSEFKKYVDVNSLCDALVKQDIGEEESDYDILYKIVKPELKENCIDALRGEIERIREDTILGNCDYCDYFDFSNFNEKKMKISDQHNIVRVEVPKRTTYLDIEVPVVFLFRNNSRVRNLVLIGITMNRYKEVNEAVEKLVKEHFLVAVRDSINKLIDIKITSDDKYIDDLVRELSVTNNTKYDIDSLEFELHIRNSDGSEIGTWYEIDKIGGIKAGEEKAVKPRAGWKLSLTRDRYDLFMRHIKENMYYKVKYIKFSTGKIIKDEPINYKSRYLKEEVTYKDIVDRRKKYNIYDSLKIYKDLFSY